MPFAKLEIQNIKFGRAVLLPSIHFSRLKNPPLFSQYSLFFVS